MRPVEFDEAVTADLPELFRAACGLTGKPQEANDLVQDTVVRALRFADGYNCGDLHAWLFIIMRNEFFSQRRKAWRWCEDPDEEHALSIPVPPSQEVRIELRDALEAIEQLPERFRDVMRLTAQGWGPQEIADELGIEHGTAKTRVWKARRLLDQGYYK